MSIYGPRFTMKRVIPAATVLLLFGTAAYAINVHFKSGSTPTFDIPVRSLALESTGDLAGLGPGTVGLTLVATGSGTATCTNPSGANQPAGQNPVPITASGSVNFKPDHSGNASYDVTTSEPTASPETSCGSAVTGCHGLCEERDPVMRQRGFWVSAYDDETSIPISRFDGTQVWLLDDAMIAYAEPDVA